MAVYAAHLTRTLQGTPSVFQITAQEALGTTVKPALRKLTEYISAVYPDKCGWCERWYDELYLLLDSVLQYHYLKHYAASFSECFYGLMRVPMSPDGEFHPGSRLPAALEKGSLLFLVLVPYIRDKLEKVIERWRDDLEAGSLGKSKQDRLRAAAVRVYSAVAVAAELGRLAVLARYLTGGTRAPTLPLHLLGLTLADAPPDHSDVTWRDLLASLRTGNLEGDAVGRWLLSGCGRAAQYALFSLQLLRWWAARAPALAALPAPPPPPKCDRGTRWMNTCPVCLQRWRVPTVLPVSGYVYCYSCVARSLRRDGVCPASGLPASERDLRRLYLPD